MEVLRMDNQQPSNKTEWKTVKECDKYEVNNKGEIRHKKRKQILSPRKNSGGYGYVCFIIEGQRKNFAIHRIVASAFLPNPNGYTEINHKDYDRLNNCVENLEWVSSSQNKQHAYLKIENHIARGKQVAQYDKNGDFIKLYDSITLAAQEMGCTVGAISNCCLGRTKTSMGYQWRFVEGSTTKYERNPFSPVQDSKKLDEDIV